MKTKGLPIAFALVLESPAVRIPFFISVIFSSKIAFREECCISLVKPNTFSNSKKLQIGKFSNDFLAGYHFCRISKIGARNDLEKLYAFMICLNCEKFGHTIKGNNLPFEVMKKCVLGGV